jgi:hypothetical protein
LSLAQELNDLPESDEHDIWTYSCGSPMFFPTKAYKKLIGTRQVHANVEWIWKCSDQKKHKVLFWLLKRSTWNKKHFEAEK